MRVFNIPPSAPFLRTLITALVDGELVPGFDARAQPERLATATLYLPTRRAGRMARDMFLEVLARDAALLPRIVALGDIDEDELAFAEAADPLGGAAALELPPTLERAGTTADAGAAGRGLGQAAASPAIRLLRRWWSAARPRPSRSPPIWRG